MSAPPLSPTERQRLAGLRERLGKLAGYAVAESIDVVSVEDTACGAASVAIGRLLEALEASEREVDGLRHAQAALRCEVEALERDKADLWRDVGDAEASFFAACFERDEARRGCDRYGAALEEIAWPEGRTVDDLAWIARMTLNPELPRPTGNGVPVAEFLRRLTESPADAELAEDRADFFARTEEPR